MPERSLIELLDQAIGRVVSGSVPDALVREKRIDRRVEPLLRIAETLRDLPREGFKARLRAELERSASMATLVEPVEVLQQTVTPTLRIRNAAAAIEFYQRAFGAREVMRFAAQGRIAHAEIIVGNSVIMLGEEAPEYGFPGPETLGGSPAGIHLYVEDADALVQQAVAAGARLVSPVKDEFYGDRVGQVADPFGYSWNIATRKETLSVEEMYRRFETLTRGEEKGTEVGFIREGFRTVTPYLIAQDSPQLIDFVTRVFGAEETFRAVGSAGGVHAEVRIADSMVMIGGGGPALSWRGPSRTTALHIYVEDTDTVYRRALEAGGTSIQEPADQEYGERSGAVKDPAGNHWYIATPEEGPYIPEGLSAVNPCLHPLRAEPVIGFLRRAFGGEEVEKYSSPEGVIHHATVRVGDSVVEMGEAHGPYQPMPATFYLYVPSVDASYRRALEAGATSASEPADQPYGDRVASVKDAFGHEWHIATHIGRRPARS